MSILDSLGPTSRPIGDSYEITRKPRSVDRYANATVSFAPMEGIPSGGAFAPTYVTKKSDSVTSGTYFESGDILVAKITPSFENGKQALTRDLGEPFGYATTEVIPIRPKAAGHDPRVLFYYLLHPDIRSFVAERMEGSTGRQRVPEGVLLELPLPCFTDSEQTAIGDALDHVQRALQLEDALSNASLSLKRAAMRALFTRGLRGEAQQETEFGVAPENWSSVLLSECATVQTGVTKGRNLSGDETIDIPYLRVANVQDGHLDLSEMKSIPIRTSEIDRYRLLPGDVVLTEGGDFDKLGRGFIWRGEIELCTHQNHVFAVRPGPKRLVPEFFAYLAQSAYGKAYFLKVAHKTTNLACINSTKLKAFPVLIPPTLAEQREIATILDTIDRKIDLHKRKRAVLESLFKSLLHKLMTGAIRVADLNLSALESSAVTGASA